MRKSFIWILAVLMLTLMVGSSQAALQATIDEVEVDNVVLDEDATNFLRLDRDDEIEVEVVVSGQEEEDSVKVTVTLQGYEFGTIDDVSETFDLVENGTDVLDLVLQLPDDIDPDDYTLKVELESRKGDVEKSFPVRVEAERHSLKLKDILVQPGRSEEAGRAFFVTVRVENLGKFDERDVKVTASIPELGLEASDFIQEIEDDREEQTPQLWLPLDFDTPPGRYLLETVVEWNNGHSESLTNTQTVEVLPAGSFPVETPPVIVQVPQTQAEDTSAWGGRGGLRTSLEIVLLVLIVILVIIGLVVGFTRLRGDEE